MNNSKQEFWISFEQRKNDNIEFAKRRKRKPHSAATKKKISESLKKQKRFSNGNQDFRYRSDVIRDNLMNLQGAAGLGITIDKRLSSRRFEKAQLQDAYSVIRDRKDASRRAWFGAGTSAARVIRDGGFSYARQASGPSISSKAAYINAKVNAAKNGVPIPQRLRLF